MLHGLLSPRGGTRSLALLRRSPAYGWAPPRPMACGTTCRVGRGSMLWLRSTAANSVWRCAFSWPTSLAVVLNNPAADPLVLEI